MLDAYKQDNTGPVSNERRVDWFEKYGIRHIAIIPDGNRRWARQHSVPIAFGHSKGLLEVMPELVCRMSEAGVHTITVWGFSTENWTRQKFEVSHLMAIFADFLKHRLLEIAACYDARVYHIGRKDRLYPEVLDAIAQVERVTAGNRSHVYNLALDYGGEDELSRASERMMVAAQRGVSETDLALSNFLDTTGQPHPAPDVVIRSSGEHRMSGFMPLQAAYSELFFVDRMFPDFTFELLEDVAQQFRNRKRRFGS
jgi:undecaprenyl diphosphate synthase